MAVERLSVLSRHLQRNSPKFKLASYSQSSPISGRIYTLNNYGLLSKDDRMFYEENGYIVVPGLIDEDILDDCCERFGALCDGRIPKGNIVLMKDFSLMKTGAKGQYLYNKAQDILFDEVFERYFLNDKLLDIVECFTGPNIMAVHSMLINKPPDSGALTSRHPLHQDLYYFPFRPAERIVAAWTALEEVTTSNGCLVVIPGSHKGHLLPHAYPQWEGGVNKMYHGVKDYRPQDLMAVPMQKGETIFFHPLLLHGSGANTTKGFRRSISCHYASSECHYVDVEGTLQEGIAKEVVDIAKRRGFLDATFQKVWEVRSRLVRGKAITL